MKLVAGWVWPTYVRFTRRTLLHDNVCDQNVHNSHVRKTWVSINMQVNHKKAEIPCRRSFLNRLEYKRGRRRYSAVLQDANNKWTLNTLNYDYCFPSKWPFTFEPYGKLEPLASLLGGCRSPINPIIHVMWNHPQEILLCNACTKRAVNDPSCAGFQYVGEL